MTTVQDLATIASRNMTKDTRNDGTTFWHRKDEAPAWLDDLCREAHGDMFPDDFRYEFIVEALRALDESEDPDEATVEADIYTHELTGWLHSRVDRLSYVDQAIEEYGRGEDGIMGDITRGQQYEKDEVLGLVRGFLEAMATEEEEVEA